MEQSKNSGLTSFDFKGALEAYNCWLHDGDLLKTRTADDPLTEAEEMLCGKGAAIQYALRFTEQALNGEVSGDMAIASDVIICPAAAASCFKAMINKLAEEVRDAE